MESEKTGEGAVDLEHYLPLGSPLFCKCMSKSFKVVQHCKMRSMGRENEFDLLQMPKTKLPDWTSET